MNVLSLFSGIGGLELGLERAGMTVVGQVEIDEFCRRVLAKHWPEVPRHDDVRTCVDWWRGAIRPPVDLVCGGFPCQPVSNAGLRRGQEDERWLWPAFAAVVRELRPRYVLMENVAALLGRGAGVVLGDLAACGYDAEWDCIPAAAVGAPHRRDRWFGVAYPGAQAGRRVGTGRRQQQPSGGRSSRHVADADGGRRRPGSRELGGMGSAECGSSLADANDERRDGRAWSGGFVAGWPQPAHRDWWVTEPAVGRVAHGVPSRVDRLRALGNAVVPQVAEHVGRLVMAAAS